MKKIILELLTAKFPGMRKDGLNNLAMSLSLVCSDKESAEKLVGDLTAEKVEESIKDYRTVADQETAKAIETYKKSHADEQSQSQSKPSAPDGVTAEAINKIVSDTLAKAMKPFMDRINVLELSAIASTRQSLLENELNELPDTFKSIIIDGFKCRKFESDDEFNKYLETTKGQIDSFRKDMKTSGIRNFGNSTKPQTSGGADDTDPLINAFVESRKSTDNNFGGKEI